METMKIYEFFDENNEFDEILSDKELKKNTIHTMKCRNHLMLAILTESDSLTSYIQLKYIHKLK